MHRRRRQMHRWQAWRRQQIVIFKMVVAGMPLPQLQRDLSMKNMVHFHLRLVLPWAAEVQAVELLTKGHRCLAVLQLYHHGRQIAKCQMQVHRMVHAVWMVAAVHLQLQQRVAEETGGGCRMTTTGHEV